MNIGIDFRSTLKRITGIGYYTLNLIRALESLDEENHYYLYCSKGLFDRKKTIPSLTGGNFKVINDRFSRGPDRVLPKLDVYHTSDFSTCRPQVCGKYIVTVHDVINKTYPEGRSEADLAKQDADLSRACQEADFILTDVNSTQEDLIRFYGVDESKVRTLYPGKNEDFYPIDDNGSKSKNFKAKYDIKNRYILYVGTIEPRKNVEGLLRAYAGLDDRTQEEYTLVITGSKEIYFSRISRLVEELELSGRIVFTGYIDRSDMNALYNYSTLFVYPSFYEGFGFPILEAMSCAKPVITSNVSSCAELAADAAITVDPANIEDLTENMHRILKDGTLQQKYAKKSLVRSEEFSWKKTANKFIEICQSSQ